MILGNFVNRGKKKNNKTKANKERRKAKKYSNI